MNEMLIKSIILNYIIYIYIVVFKLNYFFILCDIYIYIYISVIL